MQSIIFVFITIFMLTTGAASITIDNDLPDLKTITYNYTFPPHINVTIGQQFSIVLPRFDMRTIPKDLTLYQLSQQKFFKIITTTETHELDNIDSRKKIDKNIFECTVKESQMFISKIIDYKSIKNSGYYDYRAEETMIYVPIMHRSLLYVLDTSTLQLSVYRYTDQKLNFLSSAKIKASNVGQISKISMASGSSERELYIVTSAGIWSIQTETILVNIKNLNSKFSNLDLKKNPIDKLYHGSFQHLFGILRSRRVYLIPENGQNQIKIIDSFKNKTIYPQDLFVEGRKLYILDSHSGIYIYKIIGNEELVEEEFIALQTFNNRELFIKHNSIFIKYSDQEGDKVCEVNYNSESKEARLVRYYKDTGEINSMLVIPAIVSAQDQQSESAVEPLLFLTTDNGKVQVFPYNIDPRTILSIHNGPNMHLQGLKKIINLYTNHYLLITLQQIIYAQISIQKPELVCKLHEETDHLYYLMEFTSNISTCEHYGGHSLKAKQFYNENCELKQFIKIFIDDPELSRKQKILLYGIVLLVVGGFITGVLCLIQWRDNKLSLIGRIKDEIIRFRDKHRKMQPFSEEEDHDNKNKQVEFEMPNPIIEEQIQQ